MTTLGTGDAMSLEGSPVGERTAAHRADPPRYTGANRRAIAFPLGGIGTGSISIDGSGRLRDVEIFNRPSKGVSFDETFLTLWTRTASGRTETRLLAGPLDGAGLVSDALAEGTRRTGAGLPHMREVAFTGRFPFAELNFGEPTLPVEARLTAWSPFIPLQPDDSGLPVAMLEVHLVNPGPEAVEVCLYASLENKLGFPDVGGGRIEAVDRPGLRGVSMSTSRHEPSSPRFGTLALVTPHRATRIQTHGRRGSWFDRLQQFWDQVSQDGFVEDHEPAERGEGTDIATIGLSATVPPGGSIDLPVWLVWHIPNFEKYWRPIDTSGSDEGLGATWQNHYAVRFADAIAVADHLATEHVRLRAQTSAFADALWATTLPGPVMDAVSSQLSTLRSPTTMRLADGTFYGWEGCDNAAGSCEGTCSHVWNYAQALPYLFPTLERSIRDAEYRYSLHDDGHMTFRLPLPLGTIPNLSFHAAADGQLGGVLRTYRDWLISGDDAWLTEIWPRVRRSLEYAWTAWDLDRDGVPEGLQHNTYDIEFFGPNPLVATIYLAALRAAAVIAERLGEDDFATTCRTLAERGSAWLDANLFDGEYYIQEVRQGAGATAPFAPIYTAGDDGEPPYQHGLGCLSDQLIGQWYAHMLGLGHIVDPANARSAVEAIVRYNWRPSLWDHANAQRIYALEDEGGLLLATWPKGGRPRFPFPYSDEVWTGIEYEVAALAIYEGRVEDGLRIVETARRRYDGRHRNPWSEIECGNHYARGMASYSLLLALGGFRYEASDGRLVFRPAGRDDSPFSLFFSVGSGWGLLHQSGPGGSTVTVEVGSGELVVRSLVVNGTVDRSSAWLGDEEVPAATRLGTDGVTIQLGDGVRVTPGRSLTVRLSD